MPSKTNPSSDRACEQQLCSYWDDCPYKHLTSACRKAGPDLDGEVERLLKEQTSR